MLRPKPVDGSLPPCKRFLRQENCLFRGNSIPRFLHFLLVYKIHTKSIFSLTTSLPSPVPPKFSTHKISQKGWEPSRFCFSYFMKPPKRNNHKGLQSHSKRNNVTCEVHTYAKVTKVPASTNYQNLIHGIFILFRPEKFWPGKGWVWSLHILMKNMTITFCGQWRILAFLKIGCITLQRLEFFRSVLTLCTSILGLAQPIWG